MYDDDLEINTDAVRTCASTVNRIGADIRGGASGAPPPPSVPHWATTDAAAAAGARADADLTVLGDAIAAAARQIVASVLGYEDADARAAVRLRGTR